MAKTKKEVACLKKALGKEKDNLIERIRASAPPADPHVKADAIRKMKDFIIPDKNTARDIIRDEAKNRK